MAVAKFNFRTIGQAATFELIISCLITNLG